MALDDIINWEDMYLVVNELGIRDYKMQHFDVCKNIWKTKVPKSGQSDTLQGELLRQVEKLRYEAQDNGNLNWDDNFSFFCDNLKNCFQASGQFSPQHLQKLSKALDYLKDCGEYAKQYNAGNIPDEEADPVRFAYTDDDLYDYLCDAVAVIALSHPEDIPYEKKDFIYR